MGSNLEAIFHAKWPLIGVLHLPALPGSPGSQLSIGEIQDRMVFDAEMLVRAGFEGLILENFGDYPFFPDEVEPHTVAAMSLIMARVMADVAKMQARHPVLFGLNVLRNDARAALAIAAMCGAQFIRVNVHTGAMVTDQGLIQGKAHQTLRYRRNLGASVAIFADVLVKHAHPLGTVEIEGVAKDTLLRGGASALIISGRGTGEPADLEQATRIRRVLADAPILIGSGLTLDTLSITIPATDGAIVGTALKKEARVDQPVELDRAVAFVNTRRQCLARQH